MDEVTALEVVDNILIALSDFTGIGDELEMMSEANLKVLSQKLTEVIMETV